MRCLYVVGLAFAVLLAGSADAMAAGQRGLFAKRSATASSGTANTTTQQSPIVAYPLQKTSATVIQPKQSAPVSGIRVNATGGKEDFTSKSGATKTVQLPNISMAQIPASLATKGPSLVSATPIPLPGPSGISVVGSKNPSLVSATPIPLPGPSGISVVGAKNPNHVSATPIPIPGPSGISVVGAKNPNLVSITPIPIPGPSGISVVGAKGPSLVSATPIPIPLPRPVLKNVLVAKGPGLVSATPIPIPGPSVVALSGVKGPNPPATTRQTQSEGGTTDIGDTYKYPEDQEKAGLNKMLGTMEQALLDFLAQKGPGGAFGAAIEKLFKDAFAEAGKGNFKPLQDLIDAINNGNFDPQTKQDLIAAIEAYMKAQALLQDVGQGPLDDKKLQDLKDALAKFPVPSAKDSLLTALGDVQKWNDWMKDMANKQPPPDGGLPGGPGVPVDPAFLFGSGLPGFPAYLPDAEYAVASGTTVVGGGNAGATVVSPAANAVVEPAPAPPTAIPAASGKVLLQNPQANGAGVNYVLNGLHAYEMQAGQQQELAARAAGPWTIAFDRGGNFGTAQYALAAGTYRFTLTNKGWDLGAAQAP